jgi:hypothetical protein
MKTDKVILGVLGGLSRCNNGNIICSWKRKKQEGKLEYK